MAFYDLPKEERAALAVKIEQEIEREVDKNKLSKSLSYFSDEDTYIRKCAYLAIGRICKRTKNKELITALDKLLQSENEKVRQTTVNAAGEIGKFDFAIVQHIFDTALFDEHHSVRNAVIGSMKKMGEVNPKPVLEWSKKYLHHQDKEIRREICHGIELRGRTHPQDILPLLQELEFDKTARVRNTLVHVLGQIAYKKGCLPTVITALKKWKNKELVTDALEEIIDVHHRYRNFAVLTQDEARAYIEKHI
ncbi:MAG: HEAT repeat domain-containing protein [Chitinophagales bacterium]